MISKEENMVVGIVKGEERKDCTAINSKENGMRRGRSRQARLVQKEV